jgi:HK97 family phage prohead protease
MTTTIRPAREVKSLFRGFEIKEVDTTARTFTGLAAAYSLDQGGDVILPGAFKRSLADWRRSKGKIIPLIDSHNYGTIRAVIGKTMEAEEQSSGLWVKDQVIDGPDGEEAMRRVDGGYVDGMSIGYDPVEIKMPDAEEQKQGIWRYLKEVKFLEHSICIFPMNQDARIDLATVKSLLAKRDMISDDERKELVEIYDQLTALLGTAAPGEQPAPTLAGLAIEDAKRAEISARVLALKLRRLGLDA